MTSLPSASASFALSLGRSVALQQDRKPKPGAERGMINRKPEQGFVRARSVTDSALPQRS
jgi:hypothetical protein